MYSMQNTDYHDSLWYDGKFLCHDCHQEIDDSRRIKTELGKEVCEICAVKCFICENLHSEEDITQVQGDDICSVCLETIHVIFDENFSVYLMSYRPGASEWSPLKEDAQIFYSLSEAQEEINQYFSGNTRYKVKSWKTPKDVEG